MTDEPAAKQFYDRCNIVSQLQSQRKESVLAVGRRGAVRGGAGQDVYQPALTGMVHGAR